MGVPQGRADYSERILDSAVDFLGRSRFGINRRQSHVRQEVKGQQAGFPEGVAAQIPTFPRQLERFGIVAVPPVGLTQDVKRAERVFMRRSEILPLERERAFQMADGERIFAEIKIN